MSGAINCIFVFLYFRLFLASLFQVSFSGPGGMKLLSVTDLNWSRPNTDEEQEEYEEEVEEK